MKVYFENVGAQDECWTAEVNDLTWDSLYTEVKGKGCIMSQCIDFYYNKTANEGLIVVGYVRTVGKYKVID